MSIVFAILLFSILIFVHELGHFLAAKAFGANGYFFEVHPTPDEALSDGPNMLHLKDLKSVIATLI